MVDAGEARKPWPAGLANFWAMERFYQGLLFLLFNKTKGDTERAPLIGI